MHRLASIPGSTAGDDVGAFVEQPAAPVLLLTSADTDIVGLARVLEEEPGLLGEELRALNLAALRSPAVIDHYLATTVRHARLVVVRLLGGRGHWSYGLERLQLWANEDPARQLLVLAGTPEEEVALAEIGTVATPVAQALAGCMREGGEQNLRAMLRALRQLLEGRAVDLPTPAPLADPLPHDWRQEEGPRVGLVLYRSLLQAGDLALVEATMGALRGAGLCPRALWVGGLREQAVQRGVADLLRREAVELVICGTAFASVQFDEAGLGAPLWDDLGVPVLQLLCSSQNRDQWLRSSIGLSPLDLTLQVALPELDGRLTTRVGAFKESRLSSAPLATALQVLHPDTGRLTFLVELARRWIELRQTPPARRRVALVLANYPTRDGRLANGVGLDTPASTAGILRWLVEAGYDLGSEAGQDLPAAGDELIQRLVAGRTNDPESVRRPCLDHLPLSTYLDWYRLLPEASRGRLEAVWGPPDSDEGLETNGMERGFPVRGVRFANVVVLIQPERGYERDPSLSYHSPDLPPTHAYLGQYLWLRQVFSAQVVVHVGKHGNLEWLPGKALGLSDTCFPELALGPMPHLYPFIVNDPGEGSQAKRRAQAVILDHLTPPLGRAGLHGELQHLEALLDEYWEASQLGGERVEGLRRRLNESLSTLELPCGAKDLETRLEAADGYLCELKEAQIRLGLHIYGTLPDRQRQAELLLALARPPQAGRPGLTQAMALDLGLGFDPWADEDGVPLSAEDRDRLTDLDQGRPSLRAAARLVGDGVERLEERALALVRRTLNDTGEPTGQEDALLERLGEASEVALDHLRRVLMPRLLACGEAERMALLRGLAGQRIAAGPSGAPTRGRPDLLPTGRNFYSVDLRGLPTEAAWDLGRRSAELLLELHLQEEGEDLRVLALSAWGTATMRNGGEDIAQALALMGIRPIWDGPSRRLVDLEVIPLDLLGRPRVDVTLRISGLFRDAFPQLVSWMNRAAAMVAALDETPEQNPLAAAARVEGHCGRVYGSAPGAYGAGLQGLIDSGHWEERGDLGTAFLNWSSWRYDGGADGCATAIEAVADRSGLEQRLAAVQVVLHNQDNREHDLLDSDDYYQFHGGLAAAVEKLRGRQPTLWFADHSRSARPRLHRLERELDKVLRSRLLNPRWIGAMRDHGYKGGFEMAASLDYLFAYDASTGLAPDWSYDALCQEWLESGPVRTFLATSNPWALRDMAERFLEAHNRGLWTRATPERLEGLRGLVRQSDALIEGRDQGGGLSR